MITNKRILFLAPHTDDAELGCGGTIHRLAQSNEIFLLYFSSCRQSVPGGFAPDVLVKEMQEAIDVLSITKEYVILFDYDVRTFADHRQSILDDLIKIKKEILPDVVFIPSHGDIHQDHATVSQEALRAFKNSCLLGYELPWNNFSFAPDFFVSLSTENLDKKCEAIACYRSQEHRSYTHSDFTRSLAKVRGVQAGHPLAEAFETIRWIV